MEILHDFDWFFATRIRLAEMKRIQTDMQHCLNVLMYRLGRLDSEEEVDRRMAPLLAKKKALFDTIQTVNHQINNTMTNGVQTIPAGDEVLQQGVPPESGCDVKCEKIPDPLLEFLTAQIKQKVMFKWPDKSTTSYAMLDFDSDLESDI